MGEYDTFVGKRIRVFLRVAIYDDEHDVTTYDVSGLCVLDGVREVRVIDEDVLYSIPKDNIVAIQVDED
ncbi:MAG: hypothetical protein QW555_07970 [Nitrososphaerota archaeon]